jgi:hypothetical protein
MKWIITFLAIAVCAIACEKSPMLQKDQSVAAAKGDQPNSIAGTWKMTQYWNDLGNGTGSWQPAGETVETVTFGADGSFSCSGSSPFYVFGYDHYIAKSSDSLALYNSKTGAADQYKYSLGSGTLVLFPKCRENCMRMYMQ